MRPTPISHINSSENMDGTEDTEKMEITARMVKMAVSYTGNTGKMDTDAALLMYHHNLVPKAFQTALHCLQADRSTQKPPSHFNFTLTIFKSA